MWESVNSLWSAVQSGVNLVYHAAGWLEGGLIASYEKFVMDCEVLQQIQRYFEPALTDTSPEALARRGDPRGRAARALLRRRPHPEPLYLGLLRAVPQRLAQLRGLVGGRRAGPPSSARTGSGRRSSPNSSRRRWTRPSATSSPNLSPGASARARRRRTIDSNAAIMALERDEFRPGHSRPG